MSFWQNWILRAERERERGNREGTDFCASQKKQFWIEKKEIWYGPRDIDRLFTSLKFIFSRRKRMENRFSLCPRPFTCSCSIYDCAWKLSAHVNSPRSNCSIGQCQQVCVHISICIAVSVIYNVRYYLAVHFLPLPVDRKISSFFYFSLFRHQVTDRGKYRSRQK